MICVTTRFHLRHTWNLVPMYLAFRRVRRDLNANPVPGLLRYAFLVENPMVCCTFSVWESEEGLLGLGNVVSHVQATRLAKRLCSHVWSAYWRLDAISKHAKDWPGNKDWPKDSVPGLTARARSMHPLYAELLTPAAGKEGVDDGH